jgi:hypothetical protein
VEICRRCTFEDLYIFQDLMITGPVLAEQVILSKGEGKKALAT